MTDPGAASAVRLLARRAQTVSCAESLTGGRVAALLTAVPGASACFLGGVVAYDTAVKRELLGVPAEVVSSDGVVSQRCAAAMAAGVRDLLGTTWGVATTGVAGPDRQEGKAVGTVFVAVAGPSGSRERELALAGDRSAVQTAAAEAALALLLEAMGPATSESLDRG